MSVTQRRRWIRNTATGKNVQRINQFELRMLLIVLVATQLITTSTVAPLAFEIMIANATGWFLLMVATVYLDATDAMPPSYWQNKTASQYT